MKNLAQIILNKIDLENFKLSDSYFYNSLPLCVIDSIYSIGVKYESVKNVISNFCEYENITKYRPSRSLIPDVDSQYKVNDFLKNFNNYSYTSLAKEVFKNNQRTSTRNGILKSQAVVEFLNVLAKFKINTFKDLDKANQNFENEIIKIKGQKSGISLKYFYMLSGSNELIKPDRMIIRFLEENLARKISISESSTIIVKTCNVLKNQFEIEITPRELDNAIWSYQRNR